MTGINASGAKGASKAPRPKALIALAAVVTIEAAGLIAASLALVWQMIVAVPTSYASAVAIVVLTAAAGAWLSFAAVALQRQRAWGRSAAVAWQVIQVALAVGSFQGVYARPDIGWVLLLPAIVGLGLALSRPVGRAVGRD